MDESFRDGDVGGMLQDSRFCLHLSRRSGAYDVSVDKNKNIVMRSMILGFDGLKSMRLGVWTRRGVWNEDRWSVASGVILPVARSVIRLVARGSVWFVSNGLLVASEMSR